jgi:hypothetical protein
MAVAEALGHVGRRENDELHIVIGHHAARRHPEAQLVVVVGEGKVTPR